MPKTDRELRAIAFQLADEIETKAQPLIDSGLSRDEALLLTVAQLSGHIQIVAQLSGHIQIERG